MMVPIFAAPHIFSAATLYFSQLDPEKSHCMPPAIHAILIAALHGRPAQPLPLLFAPALLFSSYVSLAGFPTDSAGMTCAWSGLYTLLALRRKQRIAAKFSPRGIVRAGAMTLGLANTVAGGYAYAMGDRKRDEADRKARARWQ
ncbi:hypothetical protein F5X68DRAFT_227292 [Plectosphaerella plurivora]|uniref:Uncharacterized protein n=1 Tax=Plectosphaerella plurivora TaxID=936078 RepID=A0A9P8VMH3_9PEZI|nr:hypothetical protein F5X68DRAFT_227292 [Plectosphaerella plurivora]